jgi:hypothetical protein
MLELWVLQQLSVTCQLRLYGGKKISCLTSTFEQKVYVGICDTFILMIENSNFLKTRKFTTGGANIAECFLGRLKTPAFVISASYHTCYRTPLLYQQTSDTFARWHIEPLSTIYSESMKVL